MSKTIEYIVDAPGAAIEWTEAKLIARVGMPQKPPDGEEGDPGSLCDHWPSGQKESGLWRVRAASVRAKKKAGAQGLRWRYTTAHEAGWLGAFAPGRVEVGVQSDETGVAIGLNDESTTPLPPVVADWPPDQPILWRIFPAAWDSFELVSASLRVKVAGRAQPIVGRRVGGAEPPGPGPEPDPPEDLMLIELRRIALAIESIDKWARTRR